MPELEAVRSLLLREWDPLGVADFEQAADEYDTYALQVVGMLARGADAEAITRYLGWVVTDQMCLTDDPSRNRAIAEKALAIHADRASRDAPLTPP